MNYSREMADKEILKAIGAHLKQERLRRDLTQETLSEKAHMSLRMLQYAEEGRFNSIKTLISILRAMDLISRFGALFPEVEQSPIELARHRGFEKRRASGRRKKNPKERKPSLPWKK